MIIYSGSQDFLQEMTNEEYNDNSYKGPSSEKGRKTIKISRRIRGKNILPGFHSDCDEDLSSVASDNTYLYRRSKSSVSYYLIRTLPSIFCTRTPLTLPEQRSSCFYQEELSFKIWNIQ